MIARAARLDKIPPYLFGEIAALKRKALAEGRDLIDLGIGDPDQPTPTPIIEALTQAAHNPETHRYDETNAGWTPFLQAVSAPGRKRRFDIDIDPATEAMLLIGSKEGLAHLAWAYIDPGDISLCPDPAYTVYKVNTLMAGGEVVHDAPARRERLSARPGRHPFRGGAPRQTALAQLPQQPDRARSRRSPFMRRPSPSPASTICCSSTMPPTPMSTTTGPTRRPPCCRCRARKTSPSNCTRSEQDVQYDRLAHRFRDRQPGRHRRNQ